MDKTELLSLENEYLNVQIMPSVGGKIVSLRSVRTGEEFLLPPINAYNHVSASAAFSESDGGGFDECLPSVTSCESIAGLSAIADHGDLWRQPWQVQSQDGAIVLHADATSRPLHLIRKASLQGASLILDYELINMSDEPTAWLWSAHPLFRVEAGDRIVLPEEVRQASVEYSTNVLFKKINFIDWPVTKSPSALSTDLSLVRERDDVTAHKLFAHMKDTGWAALYRKEIGQGIVMRFDPRTLPFLGLWICLGTWPNDRFERQYTVALEPTTSNTDSLLTAIKNGTAHVLHARERLQWKVELHLLGASKATAFDEFCNTAADYGSIVLDPPC